MKKPMNLIQNLVLGKQEEFLGRNYEKTKTQGFLFCLYRDRYIHIYIQCKFIQREKDKLVGRYAKVYFRIPRIAKTIRMTEIVSLTRNQCPPPNKSISESQKSSETMLIGIFSKVLAPLTSSTCHSALCLYSHLLIHLINRHILGIKDNVVGKTVMVLPPKSLQFTVQNTICYIAHVACILAKLKSRIPLKIHSIFISKIRIILYWQITNFFSIIIGMSKSYKIKG